MQPADSIRHPELVSSFVPAYQDRGPTMENFRFDVFLSHSSKDKSVVRPLAEASAQRQKSGTFRFHDLLNRERRVLLTRLDDASIKGSN
ncbi:MAG: hypothetical protein HZA32_20150 [Opitutae bacterium]|nr:hypothetical protein [Opitutae bacterium]